MNNDHRFIFTTIDKIIEIEYNTVNRYVLFFGLFKDQRQPNQRKCQ